MLSLYLDTHETFWSLVSINLITETRLSLPLVLQQLKHGRTFLLVINLGGNFSCEAKPLSLSVAPIWST